ncbi:MAG: hypothetical protein EHM93_13200 [Bacteroidales bacterium]|nr:MAG: hypothetical protein EHM93_13200 [Bacteroidales bacterium]
MPSNFVFKGFSKVIVVLIIALPILNSCGSRSNKEQSAESKENFLPDTLSMLVKFENSLFPLPSPYQASTLIRKKNIQYDESIISSLNNYQHFSTAFKKALNLGIYGTDLSYLNIYDRTPESISYLSVIKNLSDQLGISASFDESFFSSVEKNINNKDSILVILSKTYRNTDSYLRVNDRKNIGSLILAGGWVESLYILTKIGRGTNDREIINRIGEQKHPLDNLIEILTPYYYKSQEFSTLIDGLIDLAYEFDGVIYSYSYKEPKIDVDNKIIYIHSESRVVMSEYHLETVSRKIEAIRNQIIG